MMTAGAWQVRVAVAGDRGEGTLSVPVPTLPQATLGMTLALRALLFALDAPALRRLHRHRLGHGARGAARRRRDARRRARAAAAASPAGVAACVVVAAVFFGNWWWTAEASSYARYVYKPLQAHAGGDAGRTPQARRCAIPGGLPTPAPRRPRRRSRPPDAPVRRVAGARSLLASASRRSQRPARSNTRLPDMPAGEYELFADLVHATGVSETVTGTLDTPAIRGAPLTGDDSAWAARAVRDVSRRRRRTHRLGPRRDSRSRPKRLTMFTFRVEDAAGSRRPISSCTWACRATPSSCGATGGCSRTCTRRDRRRWRRWRSRCPRGDPHAGHQRGAAATVSFPYGFPEPGDYRIFVCSFQTLRSTWCTRTSSCST